jgi:O-antigen/teichoic acid export membrane protein
MAVSVFVLNRIFIELLGIDGAALATLLVVLVFSGAKVYYVNRKLKMQPYTKKTGVLMGLILLVFVIFFSIQIDVSPLFAIVIKSILITAVFLFLVLRLRISEDLNAFLNEIRKK